VIAQTSAAMPTQGDYIAQMCGTPLMAAANAG
jgi:hypothetical protein